MMIVRFLFLSGAVCLLLSCTNEMKHSTECRTVSVSDQKAVDSWMNDHLELDEIIPIETTENYLLGHIKRVILYKDKLIVLDHDWPSIFVLDAHTGTVETHINRKGRGPGESNIIFDIAFDDQLEQILVFNDYKKLLYFDLNGNFLKEENVDDFFENISYHNGNIIFCNVREGYSCFPHTIGIYNLAKKSWKKLGKKEKVDIPHRGYGRLLVKSRNIWFSPVLSLDLNILQDDTVKTLYHLDVKNKLPDELKKKAVSEMFSFWEETRERKILYSIQSIRETEKYLIFNTNLSYMMIMNKNTMELYSARMQDKYLGISLLTYFPHDGDDNRMMFVATSDEWMRRKPYDGDDMPEKLKAGIEKVKLHQDYESNPILVFYKEK
jgi:hypothetical protein